VDRHHISGQWHDADILAALDAGSVGYLLKDAPTDIVFGAIRSAAEGKMTLAPEVASGLSIGFVNRPGPLLHPAI
jgi:DNA-binding NarL/FixJ family response regulator